jgi:hypothetical protein
MRSKLFHTIVLCGVALGASLACSDEDDQSGADDGKGGEHNCPHDGSAATGTAGAPVTAAAGAPESPDGAVPEGCGGWPPTK